MDEGDHGVADVRLPEKLAVPAAADQEAEFAAFYRGSVTRLVGFLVLQGARPADAAEIVQEVMTKAWQSWSTIEHPLGWARVTASRAWVRRVAALDEDLIEEFPDCSALFSAGSEIDEWIENHHYYKLVTALPPRQRQVMVWTMEGCNPGQIADLLQIKPATVRSNLRKARRTLALTMEGGEPQ
ncbi:RNA polymerase sigma factor [Nocardia cyriacigeorgica]|uniref:RNA polymerase sigma factor n=1 Tax=Nocardia cyriacigeorgica TaxID=135487 RepID=UPI001894C6B9|nr:sigma-70 family RNA polymerase sigma factor [Nocardia cyriacigeorgica]MBF6289894.1 sigma-70 family RNA polymerase sigma factor [Nocardia cyriacigeorgica]